MYTDGYQKLDGGNNTGYDGASGIIYASTGEVKTPLYLCKIVVTFKFDRDGQLKGYDDSAPCNGPF